MTIRQKIRVTVLVVCVAAGGGYYGVLWLTSWAQARRLGVFHVQPYLQPGDYADHGKTLALLWQARDDDDAPWSVELQTTSGGPWAGAGAVASRRVAIDGATPFLAFRARLTGLVPSGDFSYRVARDGKVEFQARAHAPGAAGSPQRFVVFGDGAADTAAQRAIVDQIVKARPDYVMITGDLVYTRGRASEYRDHFFPIYNADEESTGHGAPLLRSTLFFAAPGNHDLAERNLDKFPDGLAYFYEWDQPLNGPVSPIGTGAPDLKGPENLRAMYRASAGPAFPRMANFSFDQGDVHWTIIDGNTYTEWTNSPYRAWLEADLAAAKDAAWRVVAMHHPPFSSSNTHVEDQRMRLLAPAFEAGRVSIVFCGHVHNYQRSRPLKFAPGPPPPDADGKPYGKYGRVDGAFTLDTRYDGATRTHPEGVVYVVTGAGGARLYDANQDDKPSSWQPYTVRFVSKVHSLSIVDATPDSLTVRQVSEEGAMVDRFVIER
jgi:acid phosphatase type 7